MYKLILILSILAISGCTGASMSFNVKRDAVSPLALDQKTVTTQTTVDANGNPVVTITEEYRTEYGEQFYDLDTTLEALKGIVGPGGVVGSGDTLLPFAVEAKQ